MSHSFYTGQWSNATSTLTDLLEVEQPQGQRKPERDRIAAFQFLAVMYIKYIQIFRQLEECYDQIVHPQKRRLLRDVVDGVMGRILELKNEMVNLEYSEFHYFDDVLSDLKLTPDDIEMPIPKYFIHDSKELMREKEKLMGRIIGDQEAVDARPQEQTEMRMSSEEAIKIIQIHERARQGRLRAKFMKEIRIQEEKERLAATRGAPTMDKDDAAALIQKIWKGYYTRKMTKLMREDESIFIGMKKPPEVPFKDTQVAKSIKVSEHRRMVKDDHEKGYTQGLVTVKDKLRDIEGPEMRENMQDQIRQWFIECRDSTGKFPEFPTEDEGGSGAIFKKKDPNQMEEEAKTKEEEKGKKKKKDKKEKKENKKDAKKKGKGDDNEDDGIVFQPSNFVEGIDRMTKTYQSTWANRDESANFSQKHDVELIKEIKRMEVESEIRLQVDELMRQELKNLKLAVDRDKAGKKGKKGKSGKKSGKKKKKKSGKKSGKKGKKKKEKDLTSDRTVESLYEELVCEGIVVRHRQTKLTEFLGDFNYLGTTLRQANIEPMPSLSDVRRLVTEFCILPLGSQAVHEQAPLIKSVLIAGPRGTGKRMLVDAIVTETGATFFDLTATNIVGKYPGKAGLQMLLHIVFKVARLMPPAVVYIGECEKMFMKKVPKTDKTDPKRLKKDMAKLLKGFKPEDRILIVGTSRQPFDAEVKPFCASYQKIILLPRPDYSSRAMLLPSLVLKYSGKITDSLDVSSLAKVADGYTAGHLVTAVKGVLTERRLQQMNTKPLVAAEFIPFLAEIDPIYKEEEEAFKIWYAKTPLGKKRAQAAKDIEEGNANAKDAKGKKGGGKKKK